MHELDTRAILRRAWPKETEPCGLPPKLYERVAELEQLARVDVPMLVKEINLITEEVMHLRRLLDKGE